MLHTGDGDGDESKIYGKICEEICHQIYEEICEEIFEEICEELYEEICGEIFGEQEGGNCQCDVS